MESLNYGGSEAFEITARAILHGYRAKAKAGLDKSGLLVQQREINVVVIGSSAEHAKYFVEQILRENMLDNILCIGHRTSDHEFTNTVVNGHVIVLPEFEFLKECYWYDASATINAILKSSRSGSGYSSLHVHFKHAGMEDAMRGAMYERWIPVITAKLPFLVPHKVEYHYANVEKECSATEDTLPGGFRNLTLSHLAPVIEGRIEIKPCNTPVLVSDSLACCGSEIWTALYQLGAGERKVFVTDILLKAMYCHQFDTPKGIGKTFDVTHAVSKWVPEQRTVSEL